MNVSSSRMPVSRRLLIPASIIMLVALAFFTPTWLTTFVESENSPASASTHSSVLTDACVLNQQTCQYKGYQASLAEPTVRPMNANRLTVISPEPLARDTLLVKLKGVEMNMGEYRLALKKTDEQTYQGELMLPVCTEDSMTWVGMITLDNKAKNHFPIKVRMER
ncbi:hypothetical protein [Salinivibrio costicola]|jgi:hypothetical protein|uniref:hypothetical protein n=1 Tax=Salinivibrio costicola TaxID=51367 RepID=UPI003F72D324